MKIREYNTVWWAGIINNGFSPDVLMIHDNWQEDYGKWKNRQGKIYSSNRTVTIPVLQMICPSFHTFVDRREPCDWDICINISSLFDHDPKKNMGNNCTSALGNTTDQGPGYHRIPEECRPEYWRISRCNTV
jgi:hypothetical protein